MSFSIFIVILISFAFPIQFFLHKLFFEAKNLMIVCAWIFYHKIRFLESELNLT